MASRRQVALLLIVTMVFPMLAGCTGLGGPPEPNARVESDRAGINAGESVNFDARASTSPESTVITQYVITLHTFIHLYSVFSTHRTENRVC